MKASGTTDFSNKINALGTPNFAEKIKNPSEFFERKFLGISMKKIVPAAVIFSSLALFEFSMPNFNFSGCIWFFLVPFAVWAKSLPKWKTWIFASAIFAYLSGFFTIFWLKNLMPPLGWAAVFLLPFVYSFFTFSWLIMLRWIFPLCSGTKSLPFRIFLMLGLSGFWIFLEWVLTWFLSGFPWMPLGATQWNFPAVLAFCKFAGTQSASGMIVFFNLGIARYIWQQFVEFRAPKNEICRSRGGEFPRSRGEFFDSENSENSRSRGEIFVPEAPKFFGKFFRSFCPEFYISLAPILAACFVFAFSCLEFSQNSEKKFAFAALQTNFDPEEKWDETRFAQNIEVLEKLTLAAPFLSENSPKLSFPSAKNLLREREKSGAGTPNSQNENAAGTPDFVLWPEAAMPVLQLGNDKNGYSEFLENLAKRAGTTIVLGAISRAETPENPDGYYNSVHVVDSKFGLSEKFSAKRHLVPFGEYVPFADVLPLRKIVPVETDCVPGNDFEPLLVRSKKNAVIRLGVLVCYEDVFPKIGRNLVLAGADALCVVTNDAWYGEGAGAFQHMAHSVLQAVSLGVPVVRCGNAGWSGVISPLGQISEMHDERGSIYFSGIERFEVVGARERDLTFYAKHGDWLVYLGKIFFILSVFACARERRLEKARRERRLNAELGENFEKSHVDDSGPSA